MVIFSISYLYISIILALLICTVQASGGLCLNSDANSTTFQSIKFAKTSNPVNQTYFFRGRLGATSGDIYTLGHHKNDTSYTFVARLKNDFSYVWYKLSEPVCSYYAFDVSPTEDFFYFCDLAYNSNSDLILYKGDASTGEIVLSFSITAFWVEYKANIAITPSNDALYINTDSPTSNTTNKLIIMRWNFTSNQVKYVAYNTEYEVSKYVVALSDTEVFYHSQRNNSGTYSLDLIKAEFTDSSFSELWHTTMLYQTSSTDYGFTISTVDSNSLWHTLSLEDRVVIANQDISTGAQIGSNYMLSRTDCPSTRGTEISNNILFSTFFCDDRYVIFSCNATSMQIISIVHSNTKELVFRDTQVLGDNLYIFGYYNESGNDMGIFLRVHYSNLDKVDTMSNSSITLDEVTDSTYQIANSTLVTGLTVQSETYSVQSNLTGLNDTIIEIDSSSIQSDISDMYLDAVHISNIISNNNYSQTIDMPCSINGTTAIAYSLIQNGNDAVPNFVSYDDTTFTLTISQPNVSSDTNFTFKIYANTSSETHERNVYISVMACQVSNCNLCSNNSVTACSQCGNDLVLNSDASDCVELNTKVNLTSFSYATYTAASIGIASSFFTSIITGSSPQGAWAILNQLQILILLPLMFENFNSRIRNYILSMEAALFSFSFVSVKDLVLDQETKEIEFDQPNKYLELIGLQNGSSFVNSLGLFIILVSCMMFHILIWLFYCCFKHKRSIYAKIFVFLWRIITLSVYIRIMIEVYLVLLLSSLFEIRYYISDHIGNKFSYMYALVLIISLFLLILLSMIVWKSYNTTHQIKQNYYFRELFSGIKEDSCQNARNSSSVAPRHSIDAEQSKCVSVPTKKARLFTPVFLLRRLILVLCIQIFMKLSSHYYKVAIYSSLQLVYIAILVIILPFKSWKDNLSLMINETVFFVLLLSFIYFDEHSKWSSITETVFIGTIIANNVILCSIFMIDCFISVIVKIAECMKNRSTKVRECRNEDDVTNQRVKRFEHTYEDSKINFDQNSSMNSHVSKSIMSRYKTDEKTPKRPLSFYYRR